jgi:hypothetical protein
MADLETGQKKEEGPTKGFYIFAGLVALTLLIIVGYVIRSYLAG